MELKFRHQGFTIVELLIVIVVIGILAAITIVAFNGVQDKANDAAVQSDLTNAIKQAQLFNATNGHYPGTTNEILSLNLTPSKTAYKSSVNNYAICASNDDFGIAAVSKSGKQFFQSASQPLQTYTPVWTQAMATTCPNVISVTATLPTWGYSATNSWTSYVK